MPEYYLKFGFKAHWASVHGTHAIPADIAPQLVFSEQELEWLKAFAAPKKQKASRHSGSS